MDDEHFFLAGASLRELETDKTAISKMKSGPKPIIVPIVLKMAEFDHKVLSIFPLLLASNNHTPSDF